ncbi:MAG: UDP-N-acetylmuramoylalanine--D-glutamate ligase [Parcubacteria group bacterium Gr01-1014_19]|nr:MAG: UDP-N-acetylmuramoylalanine--D-glutamate ligase [Parcubacteria group bacterium Gr01-1014_19]
MKIAILGYRREGKSLLKFLKKYPKYKKAEIAVLDQKQGKNYLKDLGDFDLCFRSPGVPLNLSQIQKAIKAGVKFSSATKLFFDLCPATIIGVTGTKGKGTTSTILYNILKKCSHPVLLAGNIGKSPLEILSKVKKNSLVILELSSFQLWDLKKSPQVALVTDIFPDHMDVHKNMAEYLDAKANISRFQKKSDAVFYFKDNQLSSKIAGYSHGKKIGLAGEPFGLKKNLVLASAAAAYLGCSSAKIHQAVREFKGVEHRMELVREKNSVRFINDSASTNPQTSAAAVLHSSKYPTVLIAGGKDKNLNYKPLAEAIKKSGNIRMVILMGENKDKIAKAVRSLKLKIKNVKSLEEAVQQARKITKSLVVRRSSFVNVLFSPGAASFDMFKDYADRGNQFKKIVRQL